MRRHFDFQAHTLFHLSLPRCSYEEVKNEVFQCRHILEKDFGLKTNIFSYPHGDYSDRDIELCRKAGYDCAITIDYSFNTTNTDLFRLKRICINDTDGIDGLAVKASGLWGFITNMFGIKPGYRWSRHVVGKK